MGLFKAYIAKIAREEAEKLLLDRKYIKLLKDGIQSDTEQRKATANEEYLESLVNK